MISPPISRHIRRESASPSPVPPKRRAVSASACENSVKSRPSCSAVMPMPVSATVKRTRSPPSAVRAASSRTRPRSVNLQALPRTLSRIWRSFVRSARITPTSRGHRTVSTLCPAAASGAMTACTSASSVWTSMVSTDRSIVPASIFDRSSTASMSSKQVPPRTGDLREVGDEVRPVLLLGLLGQHLPVADDGVERSAQLVAHPAPGTVPSAAGPPRARGVARRSRRTAGHCRSRSRRARRSTASARPSRGAAGSGWARCPHRRRPRPARGRSSVRRAGWGPGIASPARAGGGARRRPARGRPRAPRTPSGPRPARARRPTRRSRRNRSPTPPGTPGWTGPGSAPRPRPGPRRPPGALRRTPGRAARAA